MNTSPRLVVAVVVAALAVSLQSETAAAGVMPLDEICNKVVENYESVMPNDHHDCVLDVKKTLGDFDSANFDIAVPLTIFVNSSLERTRAAITRVDEVISEKRYGDEQNDGLRACQKLYSDAAVELERVLKEMWTMSKDERVARLQSVVDGDDKCEKEHGGFPGYSTSLSMHAKGNLALAKLM